MRDERPDIAGGQFAGPRGLAGWFTGQAMARMNRDANRWMVDLLDVGPGDRVLDVGCGPGLAVEAATARVGPGSVTGVDHSRVMVRQAARRNRAAVRAGRVEIRVAEVTALPYAVGSFTKAGSLNSMQFWAEVGAGLREIHRVLAPGARFAVVLVGRSGDPGGGRRVAYGAAPAWLVEIAGQVEAAGFRDVRDHRQMCGPLLHWALTAQR